MADQLEMLTGADVFPLSGSPGFDVQFSYGFPALNDQPIDFSFAPGSGTESTPIQDYQNAAGALAGGAATSPDSIPTPDVLTIVKDVFAPVPLDVGLQNSVIDTAPGRTNMDFSSNMNPYNPPTDLYSLFNAAANDLSQFLQGTPLPQVGPIDLNKVIQSTRPYSITKNAYACNRGMHVTKARKGPSVGKCVTNRRMNPLNPKALARATRRLAGFQHFATKTEKVIRHMFVKAGVKPHRLSGGKCGTCRKTRCSCG